MWRSNLLTARLAGASAAFVCSGALGGCGEQSDIVARERSASAGEDSAGSGGSMASGGSDGQEPQEPSAPRFAAPFSVIELNDPDAKDQDPTLPEDQREIFFFSDRGGNADIWSSLRDSVDDAWESPLVVTELNSEEIEQNPAISRDGLRIWFYSRREPLGIYFAERSSRGEPFSQPTPVTITVPDPGGLAIAPGLDDMELRMALSVGEAASRDLYEVVRPSRAGSWGEAVLLSGVNSEKVESTPYLIDDGSELLFNSGRSGEGDLFWAYREAPGLGFIRVAPLSDVNDPTAFESHPHLTVDRRFIYFGSDRSGNTDIFVAETRAE